MVFCPFKKHTNAFGIPRTKLHKYRLLNDTSILDYIIIIIAACITTYITSMPLVLTTILWFISGIIIHMLFGVNTNAIVYLGLQC